MENNYRYIIKEYRSHSLPIADYTSNENLSFKAIMEHLSDVQLNPLTFYQIEIYKDDEFYKGAIFSTNADADVDLEDDKNLYHYEYFIFNPKKDGFIDFVDRVCTKKPLNTKEIAKRVDVLKRNSLYKVMMYIDGFYEKTFNFYMNKNGNVRYQGDVQNLRQDGATCCIIVV